MRCTKCGKEIRQGDAYCSGCGQKISVTPAPSAPEQGKKNGGCLIWLVIIAAIIIFISSRNGKAEKKEPESVVPATTQSASMLTSSLPLEPFDGDVLENSDYPDGQPRRRVSDYDNKYITDYRPDGVLLREVTLYYNNGVYGGKRVTNYDAKGNPTDTTEKMADGTLWLYMFNRNEYDAQGRPEVLGEYNRAGYPLSVYLYQYNEDGSYCMSWEEYRGAVYEYDFETDPEGETYLFAYGYTTFNADGDVVDQMIYDALEDVQ